jgi:hypothetical protein
MVDQGRIKNPSDGFETTSHPLRAVAFAGSGGIIGTLETAITAGTMSLRSSLARSFRIVWLVGLAALGGCTSSSGTAPAGGSGAAEAIRLREVPESQLPPLADPSPTSDPAVEVAGPQAWKRLPRRDDQYLIGWYGGSNPNVLPRIFVRAEDWTGQAEDTTGENLKELAAEIDRSLRSKKDQVLERPQAMLLGGEPWVRYVKAARLGNAQAETQVLQRVIGGRLFTVELQIYPGKILESRDQAYAVAASLTVQPPELSSTEIAPPNAPTAEAPPAAPAQPASDAAAATKSENAASGNP